MGDEGLVQAQLCALLETYDPTRRNPTRLLYLAATSEKIVQVRGALSPVFPEIKYKVNWCKELFLTLDTVDSIMQPAMVFPKSMERRDYVEIDKTRRSNQVFMNIPYEYLFRDDWGHSRINVGAELNRQVHNSQSFEDYFKAEPAERAQLMKDLLATLSENQLPQQTSTDHDIVQTQLEKLR